MRSAPAEIPRQCAPPFDVSRLGRRVFLGGLIAVGTGLLLEGTPEGPQSAEALTALRAKITWTSSLPTSLGERPNGDASAYAFWRDGIITRQSNPDPSLEQVTTSTAFVDTVQVVASLDIPHAIVRVDQPTYGASKNVHVRIAIPSLGLGPDTQVPSKNQVPRDFAVQAGVPIDVEIHSQVPVESQLRRPTPRIFTSIIRVLEYPGDSLATRNLSKALIVRSELQASAWAASNLRPTPTPIGRH